MSKFLAALWVIIIVGAAFVSIHFFKPDTQPENEPLPEIETINEIVVTENPIATAETEKSFSQYIAAADDYFSKGYFKDAVDNYQNAAIINPKSSETLVKLGEALLKNNQTSNGRDAFEKAAEIEPNSIYLKVAIARSYLNERNIQKAKELIWELDTNDPLVKYYRAIVLILYKDPEGAKTLFNEIIALDPPPAKEIRDKSQKFVDAYTEFSYYREGDQLFLELLLAKAMTDTEEYQASIPLLFEIINQQNNYRDAWIVLGYAYLNTDQPLEAIDSYKQAEALEPEKPETLFFLGLSHFANNDIDEAIHYIEKADENGFQPKDQISLKLGDLYLLRENYKEATKKYEDVIALNPKNIEIFVKSIWLNIDKTNEPEKAVELAIIALKYHPEKEMSYNLAGWAYTALEDFKKADEYLKIALSMNPNFDAANLNFGWLQEKQGKSLLAKEYYKKAYILGRSNGIGNLAAKRFNKLTEDELQQYYQEVEPSRQKL